VKDFIQMPPPSRLAMLAQILTVKFALPPELVILAKPDISRPLLPLPLVPPVELVEPILAIKSETPLLA
jgi:hypothetical protein